MPVAPLAGMVEQLREMQVAPLAGLGEQIRQMQLAPSAGLSEQIRQMQVAPLAGMVEQLREMQVAPLAGLSEQIREMSQSSIMLSCSAVQALVQEFRAAPDIASFLAGFDAGSLLTSSDIEIPQDVSQTDVADWFRSVASGLLLYGGPILVLQVLLITWAILADVGPDARARFELGP